MIKTAVGWRLQLAAREAVQRAQDQRDDENGSEAGQNDVTNPPVVIDAVPSDPYYNYGATYVADLLRSVQEWWLKSTTLEIVFGGSTSVLAMHDVIVDARVAEEQRRM